MISFFLSKSKVLWRRFIYELLCMIPEPFINLSTEQFKKIEQLQKKIHKFVRKNLRKLIFHWKSLVFQCRGRLRDQRSKHTLVSTVPPPRLTVFIVYLGCFACCLRARRTFTNVKKSAVLRSIGKPRIFGAGPIFSTCSLQCSAHNSDEGMCRFLSILRQINVKQIPCLNKNSFQMQCSQFFFLLMTFQPKFRRTLFFVATAYSFEIRDGHIFEEDPLHTKCFSEHRFFTDFLRSLTAFAGARGQVTIG